MASLLTNRVGVLATMHKKEQVIAPIMERELGIQVVVPPNFDTDCFGTFTREVRRQGDHRDAARRKAQKALAVTGETLAVASEGTFGPHPIIPIIPCDREIVMLVDQANDIEIVGHALSTETNFSAQTIESFQEASEFSIKVGFPDHALVIMFISSLSGRAEIIKGITTAAQLSETVRFALSQAPDGKAHIETDMRALYNPTRMKVIEQATYDLVRKINHLCPNCSWLGFDIVERIQGLQCAYCNLPTELTQSVIYRCKKCGFAEETLPPNGLERADPSQCIHCNP